MGPTHIYTWGKNHVNNNKEIHIRKGSLKNILSMAKTIIIFTIISIELNMQQMIEAHLVIARKRLIS